MGLAESTVKSYRHKLKTILERGHLQYREFSNRIKLNHLQGKGTLIPVNGQDYYAKMRKKIDLLRKYINGDYCYLDLPNHGNLGDHLIAAGTRVF